MKPGARSYPCDMCSYAATQSSSLKRHKKVKHGVILTKRQKYFHRYTPKEPKNAVKEEPEFEYTAPECLIKEEPTHYEEEMETHLKTETDTFHSNCETDVVNNNCDTVKVGDNCEKDNFEDNFETEIGHRTCETDVNNLHTNRDPDGFKIEPVCMLKEEPIYDESDPLLGSDCSAPNDPNAEPKRRGKRGRRKAKKAGEAKSYECDLCSFVTTRGFSLRRHVATLHEGVNYPCDECEYVASTKVGLYIFQGNISPSLSSLVI